MIIDAKVIVALQEWYDARHAVFDEIKARAPDARAPIPSIDRLAKAEQTLDKLVGDDKREPELIQVAGFEVS